jgi:polyhydroxyalkanoate synthesis regulator phasin
LKQEKPQPVSNAFDTAIFQGVLEMIQNLNNQNKIIGEKLDKCLEENKKFAQVQFENNLSNNNDIADLKSLIENLRERVSDITKKRKGLFG